MKQQAYLLGASVLPAFILTFYGLAGWAKPQLFIQFPDLIREGCYWAFLSLISWGMFIHFGYRFWPYRSIFDILSGLNAGDSYC